MEPKIPTLKDSKKPQVKVRGLEAGVTLFDRLKQFKKKDLAFILAGLGTLFMAPLAEHFMMAPEGGDATLGAGMGGRGGRGGGLFDSSGSGSVGYDVSNGQAPGSAVGGGSDVITPLNVRDPSALVMGPGATQQPPTNSVAPATPPPTAPVTRSDSDLKDALAASARGVGGAAKAAKALLPVPKIALAGAGGLRGLGVANGGSSASSSLGPISSAGLATGKANTGGGLGSIKGGKDIKGVARGQSQGGGGLEALKAAANNAGDTMNRGAASTALDQTAAQAIPNGGGSFGGGHRARQRGGSGHSERRRLLRRRRPGRRGRQRQGRGRQRRQGQQEHRRVSRVPEAEGHAGEEDRAVGQGAGGRRQQARAPQAAQLDGRGHRGQGRRRHRRRDHLPDDQGLQEMLFPRGRALSLHLHARQRRDQLRHRCFSGRHRWSRRLQGRIEGWRRFSVLLHHRD